MMVDFSLTDGRLPLKTLRDIKQDLIGGEKKGYFDKGLVETVVGLVEPTCDPESLYECLVILNSFMIDFPAASYVFLIFKLELQAKLEIILKSDSQKVAEIGLRLTRNLIKHKILSSVKIERGVMSRVRDIDLVASLASFVEPEDTDLVARLISVL